MPAPTLPVIAVTSGEPAGIGPELCLSLAAHAFPARIVVLGDRDLLAQRARRLGLDVAIADYRAGSPPPAATLEVQHEALDVPSVAGRLDVRNACYVVALLDRALAGAMAGEFAAMVTAPVQKGLINDAGVPFSGHTEYLAQKSGTPRVVMMLAGAGLRVALATTHLALSAVPAAITREGLAATLTILHGDLQKKFGIADPRILVAGLNPHAGEGGHLGREEIEVIAPVLSALRDKGMDLVGPLPADALFTPGVLAGSDAQLAMYHDQGLAVLKYAAFSEGVNITLGLPIVRTSVDHGTALDLAGSGRADPRSLHAAIACALMLCR